MSAAPCWNAWRRRSSIADPTTGVPSTALRLARTSIVVILSTEARSR